MRCIRGPVSLQTSRPAASVRRAVRLVAPGPVRVRTTTLCASGVAHPGEEANGSLNGGQFDANIRVPNIVAAKGGGGSRDMGSGGSLGAVMERSKMNFVMPTPPQQAPKLDDGGSGGDIGKHNHNGGGGGDGDGGDDDDYFAEDGDGDGDGEGEGGNAFFRTLIPESYDKLSIGAVFAEWMRTVAELPLILRRAVEMGLFSSAQLVRFFAMDVRPNATRLVSRSLPPAWAREFVGRLMADPAFVQKMIIESTIAACGTLYHEYRVRGDRFKDELDLVLINTLGMAAATSATVWMVSPTRSYGSVHKFPWQQMLDSLPNCVFDASGPLRQYTAQSRVAGFFSKAAELSAVGLLTGGATSLLSNAAVALRRKYVDPNFEPSVPVPDAARSSAGLAAFFALSANTRYQLLGGMDRYLLGHSNYLWTYLAATGAARVASNQLGETHRWWCQGLSNETAPRRRVVRKKVVVRRKVVKPVVAEPGQGLELQPLAAAAAVGVLEAGAQQGELVLDQVLSVAGPSGERMQAEGGLEAEARPQLEYASSSAQHGSSAAEAAHAHGQQHQGAYESSYAASDAAADAELAALVAQQSSIELPAGSGLESLVPPPAAVGQLLAVGPR